MAADGGFCCTVDPSRKPQGCTLRVERVTPHWNRQTFFAPRDRLDNHAPGVTAIVVRHCEDVRLNRLARSPTASFHTDEIEHLEHRRLSRFVDGIFVATLEVYSGRDVLVKLGVDTVPGSLAAFHKRAPVG